MHGKAQPARLPLRVPFRSRALTGTVPLDEEGNMVLRPGDSTYEVEYDRAVYVYRWHDQPMPYADTAGDKNRT